MSQQIVSAEILGDRRLVAKFEGLANREIRRIDRNAVNRGITIIRKAIRGEVPSHMKSIRRSIGGRFKKSKTTGLREAKVGSGVGKKKAAQIPHAHLILLGTKDRVQKSTGRQVGRLKPLAAVRSGFAKSKSVADDAIRRGLRDGVQKAAAKK